MNLNAIHKVYFIGIGGIGMSAIAHYFASNGKQVAGYDKTPSQITRALEVKGIEIHFEDALDKIPISFFKKEETLIVYTPAIPENHVELNYFIEHNFIVLKRAEILGMITETTFCLAVAGTHGKTTTSSILGHIMAQVGATSFLGGIAENYNSNLILGDDNISVVEADEYDRSFLQLSPDIACITSMDADHLDIYGDSDSLNTSFIEFAAKVSQTLIVAKGLPLNGITYGIDEPSDYKAHNLKIERGKYIFDVKTPSAEVNNIEFHLPGRHNVMNALAAIAMADIYGISLENIKHRLSTFMGVKRRFSYKIKTDNLVLIDDYAHHPTELNAAIDAARTLYPTKKITGVFQPHLFSRTKDFVDGFAESLNELDEIVLLDIYPARELPIENVTSQIILDKITNSNKKIVSKQDLLRLYPNKDSEIILVLGAGDIDKLLEPLRDSWLKMN